MQIADGHIISIDYTLRDSDGQVLESSEQGGALTFTLGKDHMLPGLEKAIQGMTVGETRTGVIPAGELVPESTTGSRVVQKQEFPKGMTPKKGLRLQAKGDNGQPIILEVSAVHDDGSCTVHLLHRLHTVDVHFEVTVNSARKPNLPPPPPMDMLDLSDELLEEE